MRCLKQEKLSKTRRTATYIVAALFVAFCLIYFSMLYTLHKEPVYIPSYMKEDLNVWYEENHVDFLNLTEENYEFLFKQTGLGTSAVDKLVGKKGNAKRTLTKLESFQEKYFMVPEYSCEKTSFFSSNERVRDTEGRLVRYCELVDVRPGDVLISLSTHTLGYRHGHCGIAISKNKTLEAVYWGKPTKICNIKRWEGCPTILQLRISEETAIKMGTTVEDLGNTLAQTALKEGIGITYSIFPNLFNDKCGTMNKTHCAHLVWHTYNKCGFEVNSDGGFIVTPWDIAGSEIFEIIQVYGIDVGGNI